MSKIRTFLVFSLFTIIITFAISISVPKGKVLLTINAYNSPEADLFFKYISYLGHGALLAIIGLWAYFKNKFIFYTTILTSIFLLLFINIPKLALKQPRPIAYFEEKNVAKEELHIVKGVNLHRNNSFPSGHTATAFAFFCILSLAFAENSPLKQLFFFLIASAVGYSRCYLLQHFLIDVSVGAALGILSVVIAYFIIKYKLGIENKKQTKTVVI